jgi:hypothetical protein
LFGEWLIPEIGILGSFMTKRQIERDKKILRNQYLYTFKNQGFYEKLELSSFFNGFIFLNEGT